MRQIDERKVDRLTPGDLMKTYRGNLYSDVQLNHQKSAEAIVSVMGRAERKEWVGFDGGFKTMKQGKSIFSEIFLSTMILAMLFTSFTLSASTAGLGTS